MYYLPLIYSKLMIPPPSTLNGRVHISNHLAVDLHESWSVIVRISHDDGGAAATSDQYGVGVREMGRLMSLLSVWGVWGEEGGGGAGVVGAGGRG